MADRAIVMLGDCLAAVRVQVAAAEMRHVAAIKAEAAACATRTTAEAALLVAEAEWMRHHAEGFDPMLSNLLADEVRARASALVFAYTACTEAREAASNSAAAWREEDARRGSLETQAAGASRRARRHADERLLATLADRETFNRCTR